MSAMDRRQFLQQSGLYSLALWHLINQDPLSAWAASERLSMPPYFDLADDAMITLMGQHLRFGSSVGPFKDPDWTLNECRDIGFTSIRIAPPREHYERGPNNGPYDATLFHNPYPRATEMIRQSGFDVVLLVKGHPANRREVPQEWPRYPDGTINGKAASASFANYTRWLVQHMGDFAHTYELWNEAFGNIEDQQFKKSFGPGGSKQNADNYADMMLPAMRQIKTLAPHAKTIIEGNYWNIPVSVAHSPGYQQLLQLADFVVQHPYGYGPKEYTQAGKSGKGSWVFQAYDYYKSVNPKIKWIYTEYNITMQGMGVTLEEFESSLQAKGVLRATVLHMRHGITQLFPFALCYPQSPQFTFTEKNHARRPVWFAMKRFMAACAAKKPSVDCQLLRQGIPANMRDLAVATGNGFTYCIWQETKPPEWKTPPPAQHCTVNLTSSDGRRLSLKAVQDPLSGAQVPGVQTREEVNGTMSLSLPVTDSPTICFLELIG